MQLPLLAPKAFTAILGLATMGLQLSYALPILMKLLHPNAWQPGAFNFGQFSFAIDSVRRPREAVWT